MALTEFGIWASRRALGAEGTEAARLVEELGFGTLWVGGSPRLGELRPLLEATTTLTVATSIANVWRYPATEMAADWAELEADFPGRALAGIGAGHAEQDEAYSRPFSAVRAYLDVLEEAGQPPPGRRMLAALAPRMIDLAASRAAGSIPYFVPVGHTRFSRERLGDGPLLAPELACVLDEDSAHARAKARDYARLYLGLGNYRNAVLRGGFEEADLADGGSDRLLDAVVPQGSPRQVAELAHAHLEAGADHVALQPVGGDGLPRAEWTALAAELIA
ncbi:MAG: TIGR03620 family F420-dependent LLM class oxidoreductase [Actinobacteria bacterium]|nr:TIGR03620 family F420-dependent LLM class oxidoreductase [Actinomycetota bacterium]